MFEFDVLYGSVTASSTFELNEMPHTQRLFFKNMHLPSRCTHLTSEWKDAVWDLRIWLTFQYASKAAVLW